MLTADDVISARFATTRFGPGYDMDDVDDFLDRVATTLRAYAEGDGDGIDVLAVDVSAQRFATTTLREGYAQLEVDDFLDRAETALRALEAAALRGPASA
ncbi:DivIVA domain-containing protein [Agrococcus sp. TSP3-2-1]|uniref:DivIVA domain-containing protein n=1 Tax=Agrococcus sp. TSP3-2-1 TaxID=2804583 RepID=UPI003CEF84D8